MKFELMLDPNRDALAARARMATPSLRRAQEASSAPLDVAHLPEAEWWVQDAPTSAVRRQRQSVVPVLQAAVPPTHCRSSARWYEARVGAGKLLVVPRGVHMVGDLRAHSVLVEGSVEGHVVATHGPLIVDAGGWVTGSVAGADVIIAGRVRAVGGRTAITARADLRLAHTSQVEGAIECARIHFHEGASLLPPEPLV